ncbi:MAG: hypothetical protein NC453_23150, partial [Muribaculum sp.]|nr:hypothetical protein [Muribaculum sp.]
IAFSMEIWDIIHIRECHQNRHKRKRFYRLEKRIEQLKKLDKRVKKIDEIQYDTGTDLGELKERIMQAGSILEDGRECHLREGENRVDYAIDLMSNYFPAASDILGIGEEVIIIFYTSPENPIAAEESARLIEYIKAETTTSALHFLEGTAPSMTSALAIEFINISKTVIPDDE